MKILLGVQQELNGNAKMAAACVQHKDHGMACTGSVALVAFASQQSHAVLGIGHLHNIFLRCSFCDHLDAGVLQ